MHIEFIDMVMLTSFPAPTEGIRHKQEAIEAFVKERNLGTGTLYIAESRVSWMSNEGQGFSLEYPGISLHAVSRDTTIFPHECLYLMIDSNLDGDEENHSDDSATEDDRDSSSHISEVRFVPSDKGVLEALYQCMCDCQALHPDPDDSISEDDEAYFEGPEGADHLSPEGQARLQHMENIFAAGNGDVGIPDVPQIGSLAIGENGDSMETEEAEGQFEDADM